MRGRLRQLAGGGKHRGGGKERRDYGESGRVGAGGDGPGSHGGGPNGVDASVRYRSVEEVVGSLLSAARDQNVCRFLQKKFDEGGPEAIELVFPELQTVRLGERRSVYAPDAAHAAY